MAKYETNPTNNKKVIQKCLKYEITTLMFMHSPLGATQNNYFFAWVAEGR